MDQVMYVDNYFDISTYNEICKEIYSIYENACDDVQTKSRIYLVHDTASRIKKHFKMYPALSEYIKMVVDRKYNYIISGFLFLEENQHGVSKHINSTLTDITSDTPFVDIGKNYTHPDYQTVTYVNLPEDLEQGVLTIFDKKTGESVSIPPMNNRLIKFAGDCPHEVSEIKTNSIRITLFTEQYNISTEHLASLRGKLFDSGTLSSVKKYTHANENELIKIGEFCMPYD